jgi:predicted dehydrogenase
MNRVSVIGAGSIGNHLSFSLRKAGFDVSVFDIDPNSLIRFKDDIYPKRYSKFDESIKLGDFKDFLANLEDTTEIIVIGTPPDTHLEILEQVVLKGPKIVLIEKPITIPDLESIHRLQSLIKNNPQITFLCGYNHRVSLIMNVLVSMLPGKFDSSTQLFVNWKESWDGILKAHPWISSPSETYLGNSLRGGGATFEHSHGLDIWLHLHQLLGLPKIEYIHANGATVQEKQTRYDEWVNVKIYGERGLLGEVSQDVLTYPADKSLRLESTCGDFISVNFGDPKGEDTLDAILDSDNSKSSPIKVTISKTRPNDFDMEISELKRVIKSIEQGGNYSSVLDASQSLQVALLGTAALQSLKNQKKLKLDSSTFTILDH